MLQNVKLWQSFWIRAIKRRNYMRYSFERTAGRWVECTGNIQLSFPKTIFFS